MALGLSMLVLFSLIVDWIFRKLTIPGLVGMLLVGIVTGPYVLNVLDPSLLNISADLRMIALIVILLRAGFELSKDTLKRVGLRALLLSFVPAVFEGVSITFFGHYFLDLTYMEAAILGAILSAVSPAVVVPLMIRFMEERRGTKKGIPTLVLAASSIDDVFVIVIYSVLIGMYVGNKMSFAWKLAGIPISIILGIVVGLICGYILMKIFERFNPRATKRMLVILGVSVFLVHIEHRLENIIPFAALLAVMAIGFIILEKNEYMAHEISEKLSRLWVFAEIILFTMVGAQVNLHVAVKAGVAGSIVIFLGLIFRSIGTYLCLLGSEFNFKERLFIVISYLPKATVQAAIGGAPLLAMKAAGMPTQPGEVILAVAVLSILLTAPLGAWAIILYGERVLEQDTEELEGKTIEQREDIIARAYTVEEFMSSDIEYLTKKDNLERLMEYFSENDFLICPVVDEKGKLEGIVKLEEIKYILNQPKSWKLFLVYDVMLELDSYLTPHSTLDDALKIAKTYNLEEVPVIKPESKQVVGIVNVRKIRRFIDSKIVTS